MAQKRMFSKKITESDAFMDMPATSQLLYFHLNMNGDDDGFVGNPKVIMRTVGAKEDDLRILISKRFVIFFKNGVCVIKHWLIHNTLKNDRYRKTMYSDELKTLTVKLNKSYTECVPKCFQNGSLTKHNITKHNITKHILACASSNLVDDTPTILRTSTEDIKKPIKKKYDFASVWDLYPKKLGKKESLGHFNTTVTTDVDYRNIIKAVKKYNEYVKKSNIPHKYIKSGGSWFNNWDDWIDYVVPEDVPEKKKESFNRNEIQKSVEKQLGAIATDSMIEKCLKNIPSNAWWIVNAYLGKRYPDGGQSAFSRIEANLNREQ